MYTKYFKYMTVLDDLSYNCLNNKIRNETIYPLDNDKYVIGYFENTNWDRCISFKIDTYENRNELIILAKTLYTYEFSPPLLPPLLYSPGIPTMHYDETIPTIYEVRNYLNALLSLICIFKSLLFDHHSTTIRELCGHCNDSIENYLSLKEFKSYVLNNNSATKKASSPHSWLHDKYKIVQVNNGNSNDTIK